MGGKQETITFAEYLVIRERHFARVPLQNSSRCLTCWFAESFTRLCGYSLITPPEYFPALHRCAERHDDLLVVIGWSLPSSPSDRTHTPGRCSGTARCRSGRQATGRPARPRRRHRRGPSTTGPRHRDRYLLNAHRSSTSPMCWMKRQITMSCEADPSRAGDRGGRERQPPEGFR